MADTQFDMQQLVQTQEQLQMLPNNDQGNKLLVKYAGGSDPAIPTWMASAEISRRNKLQETAKSFQQSASTPVMAQWAQQLLNPSQTAVNPAAPPQQVDPTQAPPQVNPAQPQGQVNPAAPPPQVNPAAPQPGQPPVTAAEGGLMSIPVDLYHADNFATGGIVAFAKGTEDEPVREEGHKHRSHAHKLLSDMGPQTPAQWVASNVSTFMPGMAVPAAAPVAQAPAPVAQAPAPVAQAPAPAAPPPDTSYAAPRYSTEVPAGLRAIAPPQSPAPLTNLTPGAAPANNMAPGAAPANNTAPGPALPGSAPTANQGLPFLQAPNIPAEKSQADINKERREQMKEWGVAQDPFADVMHRQSEAEGRQKEAQKNYAYDEMMRMFSNVGTGNFVQSQGQGLRAADTLKDEHAKLMDQHERANIEFAHNMAKEKDALARGDMNAAMTAKAAADKSRADAHKLAAEIGATNAAIQNSNTTAAELPSKVELHGSQALSAEAEALYRQELAKGVPADIAYKNALTDEARARARKSNLEVGEFAEAKNIRQLQSALNANGSLKALSRAQEKLIAMQQGPGDPQYEQLEDQKERIEKPIYDQFKVPYVPRSRAPEPPTPEKKSGWFGWFGGAEAPKLPAGVPKGSRQIGTSGGKAVYETPVGHLPRFLIQE